MFGSLTSSFTNAIKKIKIYDDQQSLKNALAELKKSLLKADVHHKVVKDLIAQIEEDMRDEEEIGQESFIKSIRDNLTDILSVDGKQGFVFASKPPTVILMAGLQGSGKTTTVGKLANYLKMRKKKVMVAGADLQRMAAVEQLRQISAQVGIEFFGNETYNNPVNIVKDAFKKAENELYDVLIVDTAGRLAIDVDLMNQLKNIKSAIKVDEVFYVADSMTGHDTVRTALTFKNEIGLDGVILSKYDGDLKGGVAISIASQVGVPLRFIGTGEKIPDLEQFLPDRIVSRLIGEGDLESLMEKTSLIVDKKKASEINRKIKKGQFNFNDFIEHVESFKKLGDFKSILGMIPGMNKYIDQIKNVDLENSGEIKMIKALVNSMTKKERENPDLLNNSRKRRIAQGSGLNQIEVNKILKQFKNASKMAKKFSTNKSALKDIEKMMGANKNAMLSQLGRK
jgi:signal recognition particle subunit SRP54